MRQKRDCDVITLKIIVHIDLGRSVKDAMSCECVYVCRFQFFCSCGRPGVVRASAPGGWTFSATAAGRSPPQRLDVLHSGGWTSAVPAVGRPPSRRLDVRHPVAGRPPPGGWTSATRRLDVRRPGSWTFAAPAAGRRRNIRYDSPNKMYISSKKNSG